MSDARHVSHVFGPLFNESSSVLILGSFPSVRSREQAFYYGNPQNRFWRVVAACLSAPVPVNEGDPLGEAGDIATRAQSVAQKRRLLLEHGIAVWDVIESCDISGSSDASIRNVEPVAIETVIAVSPIERILCNGALAGRLYHRYLEEHVGMAAEVLPSTSPANAAWSLARLVERWRPALGSSS
ncbi:G:T/U mismatch-specific DNA glycosylase [Coriobacterium glomerans PW2]|uniref:G:T/U mismatch-specific DNA glycosylase n=2 Tax=Coriobacterium TaxID=33870 RepID=F2N8S8_CORGP|nr:G:T/U mismatch-specific DNA glycosylase [Coriobacterium glomerans PW2]